jgi:cyclophilin family peptidyl-prolyl cis-trans isomerase
MSRWIGPVAPFSILLLMTGGCPPTGYDDKDGAGGVLTAKASAPEQAAAGQLVELSAGVEEDAANLGYRWYQTYGRTVELIDGDQPAARFVAPSVPQESRLVFRVDVIDAQGRISSATVEVRVEADPNYVDTGFTVPKSGDGGSDGGTSSGGTGSATDPNAGTSTDRDALPRVKIVTSKGTIVVELNREKAPITVRNFLRYADSKFYEGLIFHRVIKDFAIQAGGYDADLELKEEGLLPPIRLEANNGLKHERGTIAMARKSEPNSATSQFFINLKENKHLNAGLGFEGYAVFGKVVEGMEVVDAIAAVETESRGAFSDVPKTPITILSVDRVSR